MLLPVRRARASGVASNAFRAGGRTHKTGFLPDILPTAGMAYHLETTFILRLMTGSPGGLQHYFIQTGASRF